MTTSSELAKQSTVTALTTRVSAAEADIDALQAAGPGGGSAGGPLLETLNPYGGVRLRGAYNPSGPTPAIATVTPLSANPLISRGGVGTASAGDLRDQTTWYARGRVWMLATTAQGHTNPPFTVTLSLYSSTDEGVTWTNHGVVVSPNTTPGQWDSGVRYSPSALYDDATDTLWIAYSGAATDAGWYGGLAKIGLIKCAPGADWTSAASYVVQNGGAPILESGGAGQGWEGGQGTYSPQLVKLGVKYAIFYNSNVGAGFGGSSEPKIGVAYADTITGPYTKSALNPILPVAGATKTEEMNLTVMPDGKLLAILDEALWSSEARAGVYVTTDPTGETGWTRVGIVPPSLNTWNAGQVGSGALTWLPSGRLLWTYSGKPAGQSSDQRTIGGSWITMDGAAVTRLTYVPTLPVSTAARGMATFSSWGGSISGLTVGGVVANVTRTGAGIFQVSFNTDIGTAYVPFMVASDDGVAATFCYLSASENQPPQLDGTGFKFVVFGNGGPRDSRSIRVAIL